MARFDVVVDTRVLDRRLNALEREQLPYARSLAANQAAFETMGTLRTAMPLYFHEPTPYVVRGIQYRRGSKDNPVAEVFISDDRGKGTPVRDVLRHHVRGGRRALKGSERVLQRAGLLGANEVIVPASGLKLNRYGNVPASRIVQILSGIRSFGEQGFQANVTASSRARGRRRGRAEYFVARGSDHLRRGVYERYGPGRRQVRPVLLFVPAPTYVRRFDFFELAAREARRRFVAAWPAALRRALRTARR